MSWDNLVGEHLNEELLKDSNTDVRDKAPNIRRAVIRTSDRILFKRCRRRWGWQSHMRHNLGPKQAQSPLWFGSGMHFALEDFHGYNRFGSPTAAFEAYVKATYKKNPNFLPEDWHELLDLGKGMMDYYAKWLTARNPLPTYWENGVPQVEVNFKIPVPYDATKYGYDEVIYSGQFDRVAIDDLGRLWIVEYKSAKIIQTLHFLTDPQVNVYVWAASHVYNKPIAGVIYQQHKKAIPNKPRILQNGTISIAQNQGTTHRIYRQSLIDMYGAVDKAPSGNVEFLNKLAREENEDWDDFIRWDRIYRNMDNAQSEAQKILLELDDMLNPDLPLYPNPTRDCAFMCGFLSACASMDDGSDWQAELDAGFEERDHDYDRWRKYLEWPKEAKEPDIDFSAIKG